MTVDPSGRFAYATNSVPNNLFAYKIDARTGALTPLGTFPTGLVPTSVTVDPSGKFAYVTNSGSNNVWAYTIDASTGALTRVGSAGTHPVSVRVDPSGKFVYVSESEPNFGFNISVYSIDTTSGGLALVGTMAADRLATSMSFTSGTSPITNTPKFAYVANEDSNSVSGYSINGDGTLIALGSPAPPELILSP